MAFTPLLFAAPAHAQDEILDATIAVAEANALVVELNIDATTADLLVTSSSEEVISAQQSLDSAESLVLIESNDLLNAELAYETKLITEITYSDGGLTATVYNDRGYGNAPPLEAGVIADVQQVAQIDFQWGGGNILGTNLYEDTQIKFEGTLTAPETKEYSFYGPADDGFILKINGETIINDWYDKGGGGSISSPIVLTAGVANTFEAWYYENGGGAWVQLNWYDNGWRVVPATVFDTPIVIQTKDSNLLIILDNAKIDLDIAIADRATAFSNLTAAIDVYNSMVSSRDIAYSDLNAAIDAIPTLQQNLANIIEAKRLADLAVAEAVRVAEDARAAEIAAQQQAAEQAELDRLAAETAAAELAAAEAQAIADAAAQLEADRLAKEAEEQDRVLPEPSPAPSPTIELVPEPEPKVEESVVLAEEAVEKLAEIAPEELTDEQAIVLLAAAELVLEIAAEGSAEYEAALDALTVVAQADDVALPEALADIPGAAAVLDTLNALGNMGADMSPATREEAEKIVVAGVVAVNVALGAVAVPSAPSAPAGGSSGGSAASGSGSARRKE